MPQTDLLLQQYPGLDMSRRSTAWPDSCGSLLLATGIGSQKRDQRQVNVDEVILRHPDPVQLEQGHVET